MRQRASVAGAPPALHASARGQAPRERVLLPAAMLVGGFWWLATGLILALQRDPLTQLVAVVTVTGLAAAGAWMIWSSRHESTPAAARRSLVGGSLLWAWVSAAFYGGWIVGPGVAASPSPAPSLAAALEAVRAMSHHEVASLACLLLAWSLTRGSPNRLGFQVLLVFWAMHQLARLNIFLGVVNPATRFLPERLHWLTDFFGPAQNSPLLAVSVVGLAVAAALLFVRVRRSAEPFHRHAAAMLGILVALGALEHLLLGTAWDAPLWDAFLRMRG